MTFQLREIEVFRPYGNEVPEDLLWSLGFAQDVIDRWLAADLVRVAKLGEQVMGLYAMDIGDGITYRLHGVAVAKHARKQGLGRWLVGHAIGVTESKGGRHVHFPCAKAGRFFAAIGFVAGPEGQRFDMYRE